MQRFVCPNSNSSNMFINKIFNQKKNEFRFTKNNNYNNNYRKSLRILVSNSSSDNSSSMSSFTDTLGVVATFDFSIVREAGLLAMIVTSNEKKKRITFKYLYFLAAMFYFFL